MTKKFGEGLSNAQIAQARKWERAGITTFSQGVKSLQQDNQAKIREWNAALDKKEGEGNARTEEN